MTRNGQGCLHPPRDATLRSKGPQKAQELIALVFRMKNHTTSAKIPRHVDDIALGGAQPFDLTHRNQPDDHVGYEEGWLSYCLTIRIVDLRQSNFPSKYI